MKTTLIYLTVLLLLLIAFAVWCVLVVDINKEAFLLGWHGIGDSEIRNGMLDKDHKEYYEQWKQGPNSHGFGIVCWFLVRAVPLIGIVIGLIVLLCKIGNKILPPSDHY